MKKIILFLALAGLAGVNSYAQNNKNKNCCCNHKVVHHKAVHHNAVVASNAVPVSKIPELYMATETKQNEPCFSYRQHNIVVTECPGILYDANGNMYFGKQNVYMGNYPKSIPILRSKTRKIMREGHMEAMAFASIIAGKNVFHRSQKSGCLCGQPFFVTYNVAWLVD